MGQVFGSKKKAARIAALDGEICETKKGPKSRSKLEREGSSSSSGADAAGSTGKGISYHTEKSRQAMFVSKSIRMHRKE